MRRWVACAVAIVSLMVTAPGFARDHAAEEERSSWRLRYLALPFHLGVTSYLAQAELNDRLRGADIAELPTVQTMMGTSVVVGFESGLMIAPQYRFSVAHNGHEFGEAEASMAVHGAMLDIGFTLVERDELVFYPLAGIGVGVTSLSVSMPSGPRSFDEVVRAPLQEEATSTTLEATSMLVHLGVGSALWGSGHGDFVGVRTGFTLAPLGSGWKQVAGSAVDGPAPPVTGGYLHLMFGWHTPGARRGTNVTPFE